MSVESVDRCSKKVASWLLDVDQQTCRCNKKAAIGWLLTAVTGC